MVWASMAATQFITNTVSIEQKLIVIYVYSDNMNLLLINTSLANFFSLNPMSETKNENSTVNGWHITFGVDCRSR